MFEAASILLLLGVSVGSFINACIYRIPRGISVVGPASFCPHCKRALQWHELIPVLSYVIYGGRCKNCSCAISLQYPLVESLVGAIAVVLFLINGAAGQFLYHSFFLFLMIPIAVIDWRHFIIPNKIILAGLIVGLLLNLGYYSGEFFHRCVSSILAFTLVMLLVIGGNALFKKQAMGMGDIKLAGLIGLFLGFQNFLISFWLAAIVGVLYGFIQSLRYGFFIDQKLPFGSFLAFTSTTVLLFSDSVNRLIASWLI